MIDAETSRFLERAVVALERIAEHFSPSKKTEVRPATLTKAVYDPEKRLARKEPPGSPFVDLRD